MYCTAVTEFSCFDTCTSNAQYFYIIFTGNPDSLLNTVWLNNGVYFGLRGRQDHTNMLWGDVELKRTSDGKEYLEFTGIIKLLIRFLE